MFKILIGAVLILFLYSCSDSGSGPNDLEPTFSSISSQIFDKRCSCHLPEPNNTPFVLASDKAYMNLVTMQSTEKPEFLRVNPGNPDLSYLYMKITGDERISGSRMPQNGPPYLTADEIDAIRTWITNGAKNN